MKERSFRLLIYGLLTLAMMILIFKLSAQDGTESGSLSEWLLESAFGRFLLKILPPLTGKGDALDIRKYAHMAEFALLAMPASLFFRELLSERRLKCGTVFSLIFCFLYACTDEIHQTVVPGRVGQFSDVLVDFAGAAVGVGILYLVTGLRKEHT